MYGTNFLIDLIQNFKLEFVEKHITNKETKDAWINYVETQRQFVKSAAGVQKVLFKI